MPRKDISPSGRWTPDPVYGSDLVTKFVNSMMWQGKKTHCRRHLYEALTKPAGKRAATRP
mgnify:CR=1 FL=1